MFTQKSRVFSKILTSSNWTALLLAGPTLVYTVDTRADSIHQLVLKPCSNTAAYGSFQLMCSNSQDTLRIGCTSLYTR